MAFANHIKLISYHIVQTHIIAAAILLARKGMGMNAGEGVDYIYTNTHHNNPLYRVVPRALIEGNNGNFYYDKEKYRDRLLEAAETAFWFQ